MKRFLLGLIPPTVMGAAFALYVESDRSQATSTGRVWHTIEARELADRMARAAGCEPDLDSLARTLERFAATTDDNPVQVRAAAAIRDAMARGDLAAIGPLADAAAEEESRLLESRTAVERDLRDRTRSVIIFAFGLGLAMSAALGLVALAGRSLRTLLARDGGAA